MTPEDILTEIQKLPLSSAKFILMNLNAYIQAHEQNVTLFIHDLKPPRDEIKEIYLNNKLLTLSESIESSHSQSLVFASLDRQQFNIRLLFQDNRNLFVVHGISEPIVKSPFWHLISSAFKFENHLRFIKNRIILIFGKGTSFRRDEPYWIERTEHFGQGWTQGHLRHAIDLHELIHSESKGLNELNTKAPEELERLEDEFEQILFSKGIISQIPPRKMSNEEFDEFEFIEFEDEPLSEQIIRERR